MFRIQAHCNLSFEGMDPGLDDRHKLEIFSREVGYEEFFDLVNHAFGSDPLADMT